MFTFTQSSSLWLRWMLLIPGSGPSPPSTPPLTRNSIPVPFYPATSHRYRGSDVGNRESLAVISAFQEWRHCSEGAVHPFVVWTGHKNLSHLRSVCRLNSHQTWWALFLCHFKDGAGQSRFGICPVLCVLLSPCFLVNSSTLGGI